MQPTEKNWLEEIVTGQLTNLNSQADLAVDGFVPAEI